MYAYHKKETTHQEEKERKEWLKGKTFPISFEDYQKQKEEYIKHLIVPSITENIADTINKSPKEKVVYKLDISDITDFNHALREIVDARVEDYNEMSAIMKSATRRLVEKYEFVVYSSYVGSKSINIVVFKFK